MTREEMLARLIAQADAQGGDLITLRAIVEEASELGANRPVRSLRTRRYRRVARAALGLARCQGERVEGGGRMASARRARAVAGGYCSAARRRGHALVSLRIAGYAALFDHADAARDTIRRGAFARTLAERREPIPLYWQHRPDRLIGWVDRIGEDTRGLRIVAQIDQPQGRAAKLLRTRAVSGLSFGYRARRFQRTASGRMLEEIDLFEVSVVTHPLQPQARIHFTA